MKRILEILLALILIATPAVAAAEATEAFTPITVSGDAYLTNLDICIAAVNGCTLGEGETFSFNGAVGPRTEENGYLPALNGRGVEVVGGGVAQVATTVYLAVKHNANIEVTEICTYGSDFCEGYVADLEDAVMVDYNQPIDLRFVNNGAPFTIALRRDGSNIYCSLQWIEADTQDETVQPEETAAVPEDELLPVEEPAEEETPEALPEETVEAE